MRNSIVGALCLSLAASIWGGMYVVSKYVLAFIPPFTLLWLRYVVAFVVLFVILFFYQRQRIGKRDWLLFAWIGFVGYFVSVGTQFLGTKLSDAHTGSLLTSASPVFILLFARLFLKERLTFRKLLSLTVSTIGVVFVIGSGGTGENNLWGNIFLLVAAVTWALLSVFAKQASEQHSPLTITTYSLLFAIIFTTPVMGWELNTPDIVFFANPLVFWGILYLGIVSTAGAFFLWNKGMELMDAGAGSLFFFFQPVVGSFLGWLLLGEHLNWNFFVGGALIAVGVIIVSIQTSKT